MLVVVSDTHGRVDARLTGRTREAVSAADRVVHAGDFTTATVLDAFRDAAARLVAVHGNADDAAVRDRLPEAAVVDYAGVRVAVTHRTRGGATGRSLFGRERGADLVVTGHTHRPRVGGDHPTLLNPGSHADPRGNRPGHAELWRAGTEPPAGVDGTGPGVGGEGETGPGVGGEGETGTGTGAPPAFDGLLGVLRSPDGTVHRRFRVPTEKEA